jgi:glucokinase
MVLIGDVGGTKTILALYGPSVEGGLALKDTAVCQLKYSVFSELLKSSLSDMGLTVNTVV